MTNETVECLYELLLCVGSKVDQPLPRRRKKQGKAQTISSLMKSYMQRVKKVYEDENSKLNSNAKDRLRELLEIQQNGWERRGDMSGFEPSRKITKI